MTQDNGACLSGTGLSSQATEPVPVSSLRASIPSAKVADILRRAAELIEPEGAWTQKAFSRNADGSVDKDGEDDEPDGIAESPVCWCALGAIATAAGHDLFGRGYPLAGLVKEVELGLRQVVNRDIPTWNDEPDRQQDEVVAALREAAQAIEARSDEMRSGSAVGESAVTEGHAP